jgi:outer membrane scaffolding protein for murein synthesis (MipA/OmpV family)
MFPASSEAGKLLDYVRNYDLNDFAVGLAVSSSQNPYIGTDNSTYAYPYLTSFNHAAFTRDWLLIQGPDVGFRVVTDVDWEFGVVGRVQTLGFGNTETDELLGLRERQWAVEAGPLIGWRGWPVHAQLRSYWDIPSRHSGTTSELELSLPLKFQRGFFVPAVMTSFLSGDYSAHYFGVTPEEASTSRPEYSPGAATNTSLSMTLGYELTSRWLLKAMVGVEFLDSAITKSPLVDRDQLWSASVGLANNTNIFQPREHAGISNERTIEVRLGAVDSLVDTRVLRDAADGTPGDGIDLEDQLGITDRATLTQFDALFRVGFYHRFEVGYFELQRSSSRSLERDIEFGDQIFFAGTDVQTSAASRFLRLAYSYSLMRDGQKELGVRAGLGYTRFETTLRANDESLAERAAVDVPLPTIGIFGRVSLGGEWQLSADMDLFVLEFDRYDGYMAYVSLGLERELGEHFGAGLGYNFYATKLSANDEELRGTLRIRYQGPKLYLSAKF